MGSQTARDEKLAFIGANSKLLSIRIPVELYDALEADAKAEGVPLPELVRRQMRMKIFPRLLRAYVEGFQTTMHDTPLEELAEAIDYYDSYFKQLKSFLEEVQTVGAEMAEIEKNFREARDGFIHNVDALTKTLRKRLHIQTEEENKKE